MKRAREASLYATEHVNISATTAPSLALGFDDLVDDCVYTIATLLGPFDRLSLALVDKRCYRVLSIDKDLYTGRALLSEALRTGSGQQIQWCLQWFNANTADWSPWLEFYMERPACELDAGVLAFFARMNSDGRCAMPGPPKYATFAQVLVAESRVESRLQASVVRLMLKAQHPCRQFTIFMLRSGASQLLFTLMHHESFNQKFWTRYGKTYSALVYENWTQSLFSDNVDFIRSVLAACQTADDPETLLSNMLADSSCLLPMVPNLLAYARAKAIVPRFAGPLIPRVSVGEMPWPKAEHMAAFVDYVHALGDHDMLHNFLSHTMLEAVHRLEFDGYMQLVDYMNAYHVRLPVIEIAQNIFRDERIRHSGRSAEDLFANYGRFVRHVFALNPIAATSQYGLFCTLAIVRPDPQLTLSFFWIGPDTWDYLFDNGLAPPPPLLHAYITMFASTYFQSNKTPLALYRAFNFRGTSQLGRRLMRQMSAAEVVEYFDVLDDVLALKVTRKCFRTLLVAAICYTSIDLSRLVADLNDIRATLLASLCSGVNDRRHLICSVAAEQLQPGCAPLSLSLKRLKWVLDMANVTVSNDEAQMHVHAVEEMSGPTMNAKRRIAATIQALTPSVPETH